jgi:hypothetical protein
MKQLLPKLKQLNKHLSFLRKSFTKRGFRHAIVYINGLITLNKKTIKQISNAYTEKENESSLNRVLSESKFKQNELQARYLKKIKYYTKGHEISLIFDDTLVEREGKRVEETQRHKNHAEGAEYITGHQFFTSIIYTPRLQLPLFPKLYSKNTDSKIQMALDLVDLVMGSMPLENVIMDSWYSDKKIIKKCMTKGIRVVCAIKSNRRIAFEPGRWIKLSKFSKSIPKKDYSYYLIDEKDYKIADYKVKLNGIPFVKMITAKEKEGKKYAKTRFFISTKKDDTPAVIVRYYGTRWIIETYHWDIKQNLGFAKLFLRKKEGIVRHSIFCTIAYAVLKLFMFFRGINMTIGECISYIQNKEMDGFIQEIIEVEDKEERIALFREVFIRETGEV